jgi:hypothetical protein
MRQYKPKSQVIESLKKSAFLEVVYGKRIRRLRPYDDPTVPSKDDTLLVATASSSAKAAAQPGPSQPKEQFHKAPDKTTLEQPYVEGPLGPDEVEEEEELYGPALPAWERLEIAIQRYRAKRKFKPEQARLFDEWMRFGGVEKLPRQFTGISKEELQNMDAWHKSQVLSEHFIGEGKENPTKWAIDFLGVAESFLSVKMCASA